MKSPGQSSARGYLSFIGKVDTVFRQSVSVFGASGIVGTRPGGLARRRTRMDNTLRHGVAGRHENSRRQFLRDAVTGGVAVVASASLPAGAQERAEPSIGRNEPQSTSGPVAETLADFAVSSATRTCRVTSYAR